MRGAVLLVAVLLVPLFPTASADAGGGDAPEAWQDAVEIPFAAFSGSLTLQSEDRDWYRFRVPDGSAVELRFRGPCPFGRSPPSVEIRGIEGTLVFQQSGMCRAASSFITATTGSGDWMLLGIIAQAGSWGSYQVELTAIAAPDVWIDEVEWQEGNLPHARIVRGRVHSTSDHGTQLVAVSAWTTHPDGSGGIRELGTRHLSLQPGEILGVEFSWNTLGEVGATRIHVQAFAVVDRDLRNNRDSTSAHVLVESDRGADPLNSDAALEGMSFSTRFGPGRSGVGAYAFGPTANVWYAPGMLTVCLPAICPGTVGLPLLP